MPKAIKKHQEKAEITFGIQAMRVLSYSAHEPQRQDTFEVDFNAKMMFGVAEDLGHVIVRPDISGVAKDTQEPVFNLVCEFLFNVEHLEQYKHGDEVEPPEKFLGTLIILALGTCRGILYAKNFGSAYADVIMPVMNVQDLIPKNPFKASKSDAE